ncbi:TPA: hypothetical protein ACGO7P_002229, partial [Streptococcus suis]
WKLIQQDSRKLSDKRFYRPMFRMHLTNKEILEKLLSFSEERNRPITKYIEKGSKVLSTLEPFSIYTLS